ncbi:D-alanine--D-alanine ligase [Spirochaeta thermophila DSM 6578]|uniref:D-alanine--D-alanine ligase n=2 Tax=Winmispira thermophila TaxID=154 RepID=G0GCM1_WINT7|nr:D-alanine--D-alanine ligase [Spirochaeta thermophila DSM 6578]
MRGMERMRIALLYGGRSGEHEVSCRSAAAIYEHLDRERFEVLPVGITHEGRWYLQREVRVKDGALEVTEDEGAVVWAVPGAGLWCGGEDLRVDCVFPIVHGTFGEDGTLQGLLEQAGVAYVGAGVLGSALGMDKDRAKAVWLQAGLPILPFMVVRRESLPPWNELAIQLRRRMEFPVFVKPARGGSSVGISKVHDERGLKKACELAFTYDSKIVIEQGIEAREIECGVWGNEDVRSFPPGEIIHTHEFYDYEAKYEDTEGLQLKIPAELTPEQQEYVRNVAEKAYRALECEGFARVDFLLDTETEVFYLNEINTLPGFTPVSMFPLMAQAAGISFPDLLTRLIELGLDRSRRRAALSYRYEALR